MKATDIIKFCIFNRKPESGEYYVVDNDEYIFKCHDRAKNNREGWAGDNPRKVVPCLLNTSLGLDQLNDLVSFIMENNLRDGDEIELELKFKLK